MIPENHTTEHLLESIIAVLNVELHNATIDDLTAKPCSKPITTFSSIKAIKEAKTITKSEAILLEWAALIREEALIDLRNNKIEEGNAKLKGSREILLYKRLSEEAHLINATFRSSVESFSYLKTHEFGKAHDLMINALNTHKTLFLKYGHSIEARRIHLVRNIAKILSASKREIEAFKLYTQLIKYIFNGADAWSFNFCILENPDIISLKMKNSIINQLLNEMINILSIENSNQMMFFLGELVKSLKQDSTKESKVIASWYKLCKAKFSNERISVLKNIKSFLQEHKSLIPSIDLFILKTLDEGFLN